MITDIVITIEGAEFQALAYHHVDSETGTVQQVYGLLLEEQGLDFSSLLRDKDFHWTIQKIVQECFDEDCRQAALHKLNGEDI